MSRSSTTWIGVAAVLVGLLGCRKPQTPLTKAVASAAAIESAKANPSAVPLASANQPLRDPAPPKSAPPKPEPPPPPPPRAPVPLDEAGVLTAKAYLGALGRGRKASVSKDFGQAEEHFSKALQLVPGDPRALAERGYARLLAEKLDDADADLALAQKAAPSAALLLQILHNRMLVAKQRGDDKSVARFEQAKKSLKAARRLDQGVSCSFEDGSSSLEALPVDSLDEALQLLRDSHAKAANIEASHVVFGVSGAAEPGDMTDVSLRALVVGGKLPDGGWTLSTSSDDGWSVANHALFARVGKLSVLPALSVGLAARCGLDGLATVRVGRGAGPWHIYREQSSIYPAYLCEFDDHSHAPCGTVEGKGEGTPMQSFCAWVSTDVELHLLDPTQFNGVRRLAVNAQAGAVTVAEPTHLLDYEWQAEHVAVTACGARKVVPYAPE